jgi:dTDP-4-amino-4,6-dideoxygalactose transaminase
MQPIPQTDPKAGYLAHKAEIDAAIARVLDGGWYIGGAEVQAFEREFAAWAGTAEAVACASGTDALVLSLKGLGIGPGDRVATVSHTAVATVAAIELAGAEPVLLDIDDFYCRTANASAPSCPCISTASRRRWTMSCSSPARMA